ncbi:bromo adjacent homology (BAH) domain protein [Artemisia annua]|uniref:Bromo adjacent homology (BAH) domain protein n=1 Tax=Artemisia annua TaxID=35608 RepID=A0A2U1MPT5_ARTAN|nr:bromo adjacent homology (BAH) domain protein [Artemisia annua]
MSEKRSFRFSHTNVPPPPIPWFGSSRQNFLLSTTTSYSAINGLNIPFMSPGGAAGTGPSKIDPNQIRRPMPNRSVLLHETRQVNKANPPQCCKNQPWRSIWRHHGGWRWSTATIFLYRSNLSVLVIGGQNRSGAIKIGHGGGHGAAISPPRPIRRLAGQDYEYPSFNPVAYDLANHFCEMAANYHNDTPHVLDYNVAQFCNQFERTKVWNWNGYVSLCVFVHPEMMLDNIQCFIAKPKGTILLMATFVVVNERSAWFGAFVELMGTSKCGKALYLANVRLIAKYKPVLSVVLPPCTSLLANNLREKAGLCFGTKLSDVDLSTKWVVDANECACKIFRLNHPKTQIRNEYVEDFLDLIKEWDKLWQKYHSVSTLMQQSEDLNRIGRI